MRDDVFDELGFEHHGSPVEAERAVRAATSPSPPLVADQQPGLGAGPKLPPQSFDAFPQIFARAFAVPLDDSSLDSFGAYWIDEFDGYGDVESMAVESDLRRERVCRVHSHGHTAAEIGKRLAADELDGIGRRRRTGGLADDPLLAHPHDISHIGVGHSGWGGDAHDAIYDGYFDGFLSSFTAPHLVFDGRIVDSNGVPLGLGAYLVDDPLRALPHHLSQIGIGHSGRGGDTHDAVYDGYFDGFLSSFAAPHLVFDDSTTDSDGVLPGLGLRFVFGRDTPGVALGDSSLHPFVSASPRR